jgi:hypothetical protein
MRPLTGGSLALFAAMMTAGMAGLVATGCGGSNNNGPPSTEDSGSPDGSSGSSGGSSSGSSSGSSDGSTSDVDAGGCVFETLVTGLITTPPAAPVTCNTALCGCTDNGKLITSVTGSF